MAAVFVVAAYSLLPHSICTHAASKRLLKDVKLRSLRRTVSTLCLCGVVTNRVRASWHVDISGHSGHLMREIPFILGTICL